MTLNPFFVDWVARVKRSAAVCTFELGKLAVVKMNETATQVSLSPHLPTLLV